LRHVERAPILVHVVDVSRPDAVAAYYTVRRELEAYDPELTKKPEIVAANKIDLPGAHAGFEQLRKTLGDRQVIGTSTVTNEGVPRLIEAVADLLHRQPPVAEMSAAVRVYRLDPEEDEGFQIEHAEDVEALGEDVYRVHGKRVERLVAMTDLKSEAGIEYLQRQLDRIGVFEALERAGVQVGDTVQIGAWETEWGV
jgi:GTP-binding protein